jgi:hypothetical protein
MVKSLEIEKSESSQEVIGPEHTTGLVSQADSKQDMANRSAKSFTANFLSIILHPPVACHRSKPTTLVATSTPA